MKRRASGISFQQFDAFYSSRNVDGVKKYGTAVGKGLRGFGDAPIPLDLTDVRTDDFAQHVLCLERTPHRLDLIDGDSVGHKNGDLSTLRQLGLIHLHAQPFRLEQAARSGGRRRGLFEEFQLIGSVGRSL